MVWPNASTDISLKLAKLSLFIPTFLPRTGLRPFPPLSTPLTAYRHPCFIIVLLSVFSITDILITLFFVPSVVSASRFFLLISGTRFLLTLSPVPFLGMPQITKDTGVSMFLQIVYTSLSMFSFTKMNFRSYLSPPTNLLHLKLSSTRQIFEFFFSSLIPPRLSCLMPSPHSPPTLSTNQHSPSTEIIGTPNVHSTPGPTHPSSSTCNTPKIYTDSLSLPCHLPTSKITSSSTSISSPTSPPDSATPPQRFRSIDSIMASTRHPVPRAFNSHLQQPEVEPTSYSNSSKHEHWRTAMRDEYQALLDNDTWTLVPFSPTIPHFSCRWIYNTKRRSDGSLDRYKSRLVAKGFHQQPGRDLMKPFLQLSNIPPFASS